MQSLAQIILLLVLVANVLAFARGGWSGVLAWWRAKIVGEG